MEAQGVQSMEPVQAWYANRWWQMLLGFVAMMAISSPQYALALNPA